MAKVTAQEFAEKWSRRTSGATQDYVAGVRKVRTAPGQLAAQKEEKMRAGVNKAIDDGRWAQRVSSVSLTEWQKSASEKGAARIAQGVQGATQDVQKFAAELLAEVDAAKSEVDQMPDMTLEDRIQRSVAFQRRMSRFKRS